MQIAAGMGSPQLLMIDHRLLGPHCGTRRGGTAELGGAAELGWVQNAAMKGGPRGHSFIHLSGKDCFHFNRIAIYTLVTMHKGSSDAQLWSTLQYCRAPCHLWQCASYFCALL